MFAISLPKKALTRYRLQVTATLLASCLSAGTAVASETEEPHAAAPSSETEGRGVNSEAHGSSSRSRLGVALLGSIVLGGTAAGVGLLVDPSGTSPHSGAASDRHLAGGLLLGVSGACLVGVLVAAMYHPRPKTSN